MRRKSIHDLPPACSAIAVALALIVLAPKSEKVGSAYYSFLAPLVFVIAVLAYIAFVPTRLD